MFRLADHHNRFIRPVWIAVACLFAILAANDVVRACAVCGGDPQSDMVKGALSGVLVMVAITYTLLLGFAAMIVTWFVRARRMARAQVKSNGDSTPL
jgi:hypothetical protein